MKIAYLIVAYRNPSLINKVIQTLSCKDCSFFLHIDRKCNFNDFSLIRGENIYFSGKRIPVYWGEYSWIEATLNLMEQALDMTQNYDYYVLLSGSDYPLRSREYIHNFFDRNKESEFISLVKIPNTEAGIKIRKINTLRISDKRAIYRIIVKIGAKLGLARLNYRKHLGGLEPYGGVTWWALTRDACQYLLDFTKNNEAVCEYFGKTFAPDETLFHTILGNSRFKARIMRSLMYEDWFAGGNHPAMINDEHLAFFEAHEKVSLKDAFGPGELLFARKFSDDSARLVQRIDEMIKRKERGFGGGD